MLKVFVVKPIHEEWKSGMAIELEAQSEQEAKIRYCKIASKKFMIDYEPNVLEAHDISHLYHGNYLG